jgi:hypothetical protein
MRILLGVDACPQTLAVASACIAPNMAIRYFPNHVGPYVIFNTLAQGHRSDALVRFDADDIMLEGYLDAQLRLLDQCRAPTIIQTWSVHVDTYLRPFPAPLANGQVTLSDGRRAAPSAGQMLITASTWSLLGGFQAWWCHADAEFLQRASWASVRRQVVPQYLYLRRIHPHSLTQRKESGYQSHLRNYYAQQMMALEQRRLAQVIPALIDPVVSRYVSSGLVIDGKHVIRAN